MTRQQLNKSFISKNKWEVIKSLKKNDFTLIKEDDKGGAVIVMNKTHYYKHKVACKKKKIKIMTKKFSKILNILLTNSAIVYEKKKKIF